MSRKLPSYFETLDSHTLCRGGGNGPKHESQLYAIKKYVTGDMTFLDYGCGSGTTLEALEEADFIDIAQNYTGVDIISKNIDWCRQKWLLHNFEVNSNQDKIDQPDKSFDVVYSRHVVDHMKDFSSALAEHCRVAKQLVIIVLWKSFTKQDQLIPIKENNILYAEYTNSYSKKTVLEAIGQQKKNGWKLLEIKEGLKGIDGPAAGNDIVIVLEREK